MGTGVLERLRGQWPTSMRSGAILAAFILVSFPATVLLIAALLATALGDGAITIGGALVMVASLVALVVICAAWAKLLAPHKMDS